MPNWFSLAISNHRNGGHRLSISDASQYHCYPRHFLRSTFRMPSLSCKKTFSTPARFLRETMSKMQFGLLWESPQARFHSRRHVERSTWKYIAISATAPCGKTPFSVASINICNMCWRSLSDKTHHFLLPGSTGRSLGPRRSIFGRETGIPKRNFLNLCVL